MRKIYIEFEYKGYYEHIAPKNYTQVLARSVFDLLEIIGYEGVIDDDWYLEALEHFVDGGLTFNYGDFDIRLIDNTPDVLKLLKTELKEFREHLIEMGEE